jgi:hypothetical protein
MLALTNSACNATLAIRLRATCQASMICLHMYQEGTASDVMHTRKQHDVAKQKLALACHRALAQAWLLPS